LIASAQVAVQVAPADWPVMLIKMLALVLPLGLDTFAISAAPAVGGLSRERRMRTSLLFGAFEAGMPLVGLAIGRPLGSTIGNCADYLAIGVLLVLAVHMVLEDDVENGSELTSRLDGGAVATIALDISVSLDELAIGFTLGLLRVPAAPVIALIGLQALLLSQLGMRLGERIAERVRERAERLAGAALALLGIGLLITKLAG
jgi:putative Mn2+ efflux pump MntP